MNEKLRVVFVIDFGKVCLFVEDGRNRKWYFRCKETYTDEI
jgi:hypothetical protein